MSQKGISNVLKKLQKSVEDGDYYAAQQMYKTLLYRYVIAVSSNVVGTLGKKSTTMQKHY
jgi:hypothetical protein